MRGQSSAFLRALRQKHGLGEFSGKTPRKTKVSKEERFQAPSNVNAERFSIPVDPGEFRATEGRFGTSIQY